MIGTDYMNDPTTNAIFPDKRDKSEIAIEILNECLDDISDEILYQAGIKIHSELYIKILKMIYKTRDKVNAIA